MLSLFFGLGSISLGLFFMIPHLVNEWYVPYNWERYKKIINLVLSWSFLAPIIGGLLGIIFDNLNYIFIYLGFYLGINFIGMKLLY